MEKKNLLDIKGNVTVIAGGNMPGSVIPVLKRITRILFLYVPAGLVLMSLLWVVLYRFVPVRWTPLMLRRSIENIDNKDFHNQRTWVDIEDIAQVMVRAVIASEDGRFMTHKGFDFEEMDRMMKEHEKKGGKIRGCSTISQQTAKNCFTFGSKTWLRKGVEAYYTFLIELFWGKKRIMEVYLNVAETGKGLYGVEAASMKYFKRHASALTQDQAICLACILPNPLVRRPDTISSRHRTKYDTVERNLKYTHYPF